jgi:hypothetical protein
LRIQVKSGDVLEVRGFRWSRGGYEGERNMVMSKSQEKLDADERDVAGEKGART